MYNSDSNYYKGFLVSVNSLRMQVTGCLTKVKTENSTSERMRIIFYKLGKWKRPFQAVGRGVKSRAWAKLVFAKAFCQIEPCPLKTHSWGLPSCFFLYSIPRRWGVTEKQWWRPKGHHRLWNKMLDLCVYFLEISLVDAVVCCLDFQLLRGDDSHSSVPL